MEDRDIKVLADLLERAGYEEAERLIREDLIPLAQEKGISLWEAANQYADDGEEQDTSWYQLWDALTKVTIVSIQELDIHKPLISKTKEGN